MKTLDTPTVSNPLDCTRTIQGVQFEAVRFDHPRIQGGHFYQVKVSATGITWPQSYRTRPALWEDLEHCAKLCGEHFATDSLKS